VQKISLGRRLVGRWWMLLVAVLVVALAALCVYRLHGIFGSNHSTATPRGFVNEIVPFNPKRIVLEVFGPTGAVATINYLDINAQPQHADDVTLPWSYDASTTQPGAFLNVVAQGNSDSLGCRILVDGVVKDERQVNTMNAYVYCLDKNG
jgi:Mycobacterium membrane protein